MNRLKNLAKIAFHGVYKYSGVAFAQEAAARRAGKRFLAILLFHRVTDQIPEDGLTVSTAHFRAICRMLKRDFHVVSVSEIARLHRSGQPLPPRTVALTFDDCYRDNLFAARVLAEHGLTASFFIPTAFVETDHVFPWDHHLPRLENLTWNDVREMAALGHAIGSHTINHVNLGHVALSAAQREIIESKRILEEKVGMQVRWFAYPYGGVEHFRPGLASYVEEAGYEGCLSGFGGFIYPDTDRRLLPREAVPYFPTAVNLELHLRGCLDWVYALKRRVGLMEDRPQMSRYQEQVLKEPSEAVLFPSPVENH
jgi:peptidoglycan/xylan/chitin deacetylase (PgdA/CDA1 family)